MPDTIDKVRGCVLQHGKCSNRIYVMKLADSHVPETIECLDGMARENGYTKIIAKVPASAKEQFESHGYASEATIPGFYNGTVDASFMGKYFSEKRQHEDHADTILDVLRAASQRTGEGASVSLGAEYSWRIADEADAEQITEVYKTVFATYPFPIRDAEYIRETMRDNIVYFCVHKDGRMVSVASSEMDCEAQNVEMTDFATLPDHRCGGSAGFLLARMEEEMLKRGIRTAYTIARAVSFGMNITFAKLDYRYGGTLTKNTDICGSMESMNIWYKPL